MTIDVAPHTYLLPFQPPLDWSALLAFFEKRAIPGVESVVAGHYRRTLAYDGVSGWASLALAADNQLLLTLSDSLVNYADVLVAQARVLCDLDQSPDAVKQVLGELATAHPGLRVPGTFDGFETAVRAILGQQITVAAATTLSGRVARQLGAPVATPFPELTHQFPRAAALLAASVDSLGSMGIIRSRIKAIQALADACYHQGLRLTADAEAAASIRQLKSLPGIGDWTAQYIAMRALGHADAFPETDHGILKALQVSKGKQARALAEKWRPYRAYAVMHLWQQLTDKA